MPDYNSRDISAEAARTLKSMPVVVVTGIRQTRKTTFLRSEPGLADRTFFSFDDFAQLEAAKSGPDGFVSHGRPIAIDEAQKCPEIFGPIKRAADKKRIPGQFFLSGSARTFCTTSRPACRFRATRRRRWGAGPKACSAMSTGPTPRCRRIIMGRKLETFGGD